MKTFHLIILLVSFYLCSCGFTDHENIVDTHENDSTSVLNSDSTSDNDTPKPVHREYLSADERVQKMVMNLPEVKRISLSIDSARKSKNNVTAVIEQNPSNDDPYYGITIKDKNAKQDDKLFQFFVDPGTNQIKIYDAGEDRLISLAEWRKIRTQ